MEKPKLNKESLEKHFPNHTEIDLSYVSPIKVIMDNFSRTIEHDIEKEVYKVVRHYGIEVDREELLKALQYDRKQYELGYQAGLHKASEVAREIFSELEATFYGDGFHYFISMAVFDILKKKYGGDQQ